MNLHKKATMKTQSDFRRGLTLVELLVTLFIMGIIAMVAIPLMSTLIAGHDQGIAKSQLYQEGLLAIERMTSGVRRCTFLLIPNAQTPVRDMLAFSGLTNDDGDAYFGDSLFPRFDEDSQNDMTDDIVAGIDSVDDDGDGMTDEGSIDDDDEDGLVDEEILDALDQDADGNIDEDFLKDANNDGFSGILGMDDDGDGLVDNGLSSGDDDEDGLEDEDKLNPLIYLFNSGTNTLTESKPDIGASMDLSTHVSLFQVTYETPDPTHAPRLQIALTLTGNDGESVSFVEYVYPRNIVQKTGKRVR